MSEILGRDVLVDHVRRHLVGPLGGSSETIADAPSFLYTAGVLFPIGATTELLTATEGGDGGAGGAGNELVDDAVSLANERLPSSAAISFFLAGEGASIDCTFAAARYREEEGDQGWRRLPGAPETARLSSAELTVACLEGAASLVSRWRPAPGGHLVTVALVNRLDSERPALHEPESCLFQVELTCRPHDGTITEYPAIENIAMGGDDAELALRYSHVKTYAIGHGCSAEWATGEQGASSVGISFVPFVEVSPLVVATGDDPVLSLRYLRDSDAADLSTSLSQFVDGYENWLSALELDADTGAPTTRAAKARILERVRRAVERMRSGVTSLDDPELLRSFQLAHAAMVRQMEHSAPSLGGAVRPLSAAPEMPDPSVYQVSAASWRPFQLAYILVCLSSLTDPDDEDRFTVDLIWAATGAGKTEAYLALAAISIIHRRITAGVGSGGTTVLTRYTLRLLTAQQFERTGRLACALETMRSEEPDLGSDPITIGLWIGSDTPTQFSDALDLANEILEDGQPSGSFQLEKCPWCGVRIIPKRKSNNRADYGFEASNDHFHFRCPNERCEFHDLLPIQVVDAALYLDPPTILIGTVDKFARLAWLGDAGVFFGGSDRLPPSLIIQDELHLLSGPLGTTVGIYESALETLCEVHGTAPKVVAATATIRESEAQINALYGRNSALFPPAGLDARDSYFTKIDSSAAGRGYLGVLSPSHTPTTSLVRTCAVLVQGALELPLTELERDAYWTLVAYHNSLRELGKTITLARDDIPAWIHMVAADPEVRRELHDDAVLELTGNVDSARIPASLDRLSTPYGQPGSVSFAACTNMLSVGVDIQRLGLMVVHGQPKTTSEYIQASSRVGRSDTPGLVVAHYSSTKPRDRSHYEQFGPYHEALYRWVEPTSVTPFSLSARKRALHAALVILIRHGAGLSANSDAARFDASSDAVRRCVELLASRAERADPDEDVATREHLKRLVDRWTEEAKLASGDGQTLHYNSKKPHPSLLTNFDSSWGAWPTLHSMRNVDKECTLDVVTEYIDR
jgi:hypothetical protein